ncbi:MAG: PAS domain S-box protein [Candidatus Omnitrophota bacterium]
MTLDQPEKKIHGHESAISGRMTLMMILWFSFITAAIVLGGFVYYGSEARRIQKEKSTELATIGKMKVDQILRWRKERSDDSKRIVASPLIQHVLGQWMGDPNNNGYKNELMTRLKLELDSGVYCRAFFMNEKGEVLVSASSEPIELSRSEIGGVIEKAFRGSHPVFSDFHRTSDGTIHMDIVTAVRDGKGHALAVLVLTTDAREFLFPLIQTWPTPSLSAETLLVRREGDQVLFLNDLRHQKGTALNLRLPISRKDLPASAAVLGKTGSFLGKDYRRVEVLSDIRPVPGTSWSLVSKVDADEILEEVRYRAGVVALITTMLILFAVGVAVIFQKNKHLEERKKSIALLQASEERFRLLYERAPLPYQSLDKEGHFIEVNATWLETMGYSREEVIGRWFGDFLTPEYAELFSERFLCFHAAKEVHEVEFDMVRKDGGILRASFDGKVGFDRDGFFQRTHCIFIDITERKKREDERYRLWKIMDWSLNEIYMFDLNTLKFNFVNSGALKNLGYSMEEMLSLTPLDLKPEFTETAFRRKIRELIDHEKDVLIFETAHKRKDGTLYPVEVHLQLVETHEEKNFVAIIFDMTEIAKTNEARRRAEARYGELVEGTDDMVTLTDTQGRFIFVNHSAEKFFGIKSEDCLGRLAFDFIHPDDRERTKTAFEGWVRHKEKRVTFENRQVHKNGQVFDILWNINLSFSDSGEVVQVISFGRDVTEFKKAEEEIKKLNAELEERVKRRTEELAQALKDQEAFSYSVSHDLKAPLRAMGGFANILAEDYAPKLDENGRRVIGVITENVEKMGRLIEDLLRLAHFGKRVVDVVDVDMEKFAQSVFREVKEELYRDRDIEVSIKPMPPARADLVLAKQIFQNLISNAMKFTSRKDKSVIEIGSYEKDGECVYYVRDNGAGFDMKYGNKLFGVFQRLHSRDIFEGSGIGLAIVKSAVQRHGGRVWAEGEVGQGATFYFTLLKGG